MSDFDEWFKKTMPNTHKGVGKKKIETFTYQTAEDAWKHQQQKIDEYAMVAEALDESYVRECKKNKELQKRIDTALNKSKDFYDFGDGESAMAFCNEIINILKGETHES